METIQSKKHSANASPRKDLSFTIGTFKESSHQGSQSSVAEDQTPDISSLRRMWEASSDNVDAMKSSPSVKKSVKFEKRVWPPVQSSESEKPVVPVKPTVQFSNPEDHQLPVHKNDFNPHGPKPNEAHNPAVQVKSSLLKRTESIQASKFKFPNKSNEAIGDNRTIQQVPQTPSREFLIGSAQSLEDSIDRCLRKNINNNPEDLSASSQQLSARLSNFTSGCTGFIDSIPVTGRFRFKSLLSTLEDQAKEIRMGGVRQTKEIQELKNSLKGLVGVLQKC